MFPGQQVVNLGNAEVEFESGNEDQNVGGLNVSQEFDQQVLDVEHDPQELQVNQQESQPVSDFIEDPAMD